MAIDFLTGTMMETAHLLTSCEFKLAPSGAAMLFSGYAAVFGNVDAYGDVIEPGAFNAWLEDIAAKRQDWPAMLSQHGGMGLSVDDATPVGVWKEFARDSVGLAVTGQLADTPRGKELYALMKMTPPAISGLSIGYIAKEWDPPSKAGDPRRRLKRVDVMEISPVTFPANRRARVTGIKSGAFSECPGDIRALERGLRSAFGFTALEAKRIASGGWSALRRDDADGEAAALEELAGALRRNIATLRA